MKFCKDCRFFRPGAFYVPDKCLHPVTERTDPVTGLHRGKEAKEVRQEGAKCGPGAILFEPRKWWQRRLRWPS